MANFLDDLSVYNAKAALAISQAAADGNTDKANMMSSLKTTANDTTLTEAIRLNALTALINLGSLLDVPLPPYFPLTVTYANTETYIGIHDDLSGLQGGAPGDYQHLTTAEKVAILNKASIGDITFANLGGIYSDNNDLAAVIDGKQTELNGVGLVRINGNQSTITYDNTPYISTISGIAAGGELTGTYPNPALSNAAVIAKVLTGWNGSATYTAITSSDTILSGMEKLNARISQVIASPGGVSSIAGGTNAPSVLNVAASSSTGNVTFSVDFDTQNQNLFLASPNGSSGAPSFRAIAVNDLPNSGATAGTYGTAALIPQITVDAKGRITAISNVTANTGGLVTAVSITGPAIFTSYQSTGGATPQLSFALANQSANLVFAGPETGAATTPTFRALVEDDVPFLAGIVSGLQSQINSRLPQSLNTSLIYMGNGSGVAAQSVVGGDLTAAYTEPGNVNTATFTIANEAVTYAKFANIPDSALNTIRPILLGRFSSGQGPMQQLTLSGDFTLNAGTGEIGLLTPNPPELTDAGDLLTSSGSNNLERLSLPVDYATKGYLLVPYTGTTSPDIKLIWGEAGGDITYSINTTATPFPEFAIGANKVTLGKMQQLPAYTVIGNDTSGSLTPKALTKTELTTLVEQFTSSTPGVVPLSGGGTTNFLRADGSWTAPPSGGGTTTNALANGTGILSFSFDGGTPGVTVDIDNTIVATLTDTQTLTNKTLSTGTAIDITAPVVGTMWYSSDTDGTLAELDSTGNGGKFLMLNATTLVPEWTGITGGGIAIGDTITGATAGSVLFAGTAGVLAQENGDFFWDNTNKFLGIGTATPECGLHVVTSGSANIKGVMNMHFDSNAANQAKFIGARGRGNKNSPSAIQADDAITSLSGRGYKTSAWSNTVGGFYIYASENWTDSITGTYLTFRGVANGGTAITEWGRISNNATTTTFNIGATSAVALTTAATTASIFNTTATTLNIGGAATAVNLGGGSGCAISLGGGANVAELRFLEASANGTNYTAIKAADVIGTSYTVTLPANAPTAGTYLKSDAFGVLSWNDPGAGSVKSFKSIGKSTGSNTGTETLQSSVLIPANTITAGDTLNIFAIYSKEGGTARTYVWRIWANTTNNLSGTPVLIGDYRVGPTGITVNGVRELSVLSTTGANNNLVFPIATASQTQFAPYNTSTTAISTPTIDWTVDQYIIIGMLQQGSPIIPTEIAYSYGIDIIVK